MKRQDVLSILITFVVGFSAGLYLYTVEFAANVTKLAIDDEESASEFVIVGEMYGGSCAGRCPAFQVTKQAAFRYLYYASDAAATASIREGRLPTALYRDLRRVLQPTDLALQAKPVAVQQCASDTGGIDVFYEITLEGEEYLIDSCGTAYNPQSELWQTLTRVWQQVERVE